MSESPKVDSLVFAYRRLPDGTFEGRVETRDNNTGRSLRPPLSVALQRPEWVRFVVEQIRSHADIERVSVELVKPDSTVYLYALDARTVSRIKDGTFEAEDLVL